MLIRTAVAIVLATLLTSAPSPATAEEGGGAPESTEGAPAVPEEGAGSEASADAEEAPPGEDAAAEAPESPPEPEPEPEPAEPPEPEEAPEPEPEPTAEAEPLPPIDGTEGMMARLRGALVEYRTAWATGRGVLVGDGRTVVTMARIPNTGRRITVRPIGEADAEADAEAEAVVTSVGVADRRVRRSPFLVMHLDSDLPGVPLQAADRPALLGDRVYVTVRPGGGGPHGHMGGEPGVLEMAETVVTAASETGFALGTSLGQVPAGSAVFDASGQVVGFVGRGDYAFRVHAVTDPEVSRERGMPMTPVWGIRLGTEIGGFLDQPFVMDFDIGLALWDQLGIGLRIGFGVASPGLYGVPANAVREAGVVEATQGMFNLGVEVEYRLLLTRAPMPFYLDVAVGVSYNLSIVDPEGPALYSTEAECEPFGQDCGLAVGPAPGRWMDHGVGPHFGADVRVGALTFGYRFVPAAISHNMSDTHRLTFGITML